MSLVNEATWRWPDIDQLLELSETSYGSLLYSVRILIGRDLVHPSMSPAYSVISKLNFSAASTADTDPYYTLCEPEDHEDALPAIESRSFIHKTTEELPPSPTSDSYGACLFPEESSTALSPSIEIPSRKRKQKRNDAKKTETPALKKQKKVSPSKQIWFEERYGGKNSAPPTARIQCRFFQVGQCKNKNCIFAHEEGLPLRKIDEPCRFNWPDRHSVRCNRKECVFSHDLGQFSCPFLHGLGSCSFANCGFCHENLVNEKQKIKFARVFKNFLSSQGVWNDYLKEEVTEGLILQRSIQHEIDS